MFEYFLAGFMSTATRDMFEVEQFVDNLKHNRKEILDFLTALKCDGDSAVWFGQSLGGLVNSETLDGLFHILEWVYQGDCEDDEIKSKQELLKDLAESLELI